MTAILQGWEKLPAILRGVITLATGGVAAILLFVQATELPARVARLEDDNRQVATALAVLLCRAVREDEGKDPGDCRVIVGDMDTFLRELAR